jgi:hypothetical protein
MRGGEQRKGGKVDKKEIRQGKQIRGEAVKSRGIG